MAALALSSNRIQDKEFYRSVHERAFNRLQATNKGRLDANSGQSSLEQEFQRFISFDTVARC